MKINKTFLIIALIVLSACLLSSAVQALKNNSVIIQDFAFQPNIITVQVGSAVTWTNNDTVQHEVISDNGTFDSGLLMPNASFSYTFNQPGNYSYYDKIYPYILGQIQVIQGQVTLNTTGVNSSPDPAPGTPPQPQPSMFSQFFRTPSGPAPKNHITSPKNYPIKNLGSTFVYFNVPTYTTSYSMTHFMPSSYQLYSMPYSQYYGNYASYSGGTSLWIQGTSGLTQYVTVPLGASLSLLAISPTGGNGYIYETAPGSISNTNYYYFNQYNQMTFYANILGQYVLMASINGRMSNAITINVVSSVPSNIVINNQAPNYSPPASSYPSPGGY